MVMMRDIYSSKMNKRAQFFILSAVIIASIIVSLASVKNFATTGDAPKKFYYYSQQLEDEAGAVVDYALYNDPSGTDTNVKNNLNNFLQQSIEKTLEGDPGMEIFACYTNSSNSTALICQNNGTSIVTINVSLLSQDKIRLSGSKNATPICTTLGWVTSCLNSTGSLSISGKNTMTISLEGGQVYTICLSSPSVQRGQFYFLLKMNTSAGDYVADSGGADKVIC